MKGYYDKAAAGYDRRWRKFSERTHGEVLGALPGDVQGRVLDIGCGTGALLEKLLERYPDIQAYGADVNKAMLAEARKKLGNRVKLRLQTPERLPEFAEPFDVIISSNVLHYIENPTDWLVQMRDMLKPGGLLILQDLSASSRTARFGSRLIQRVDEGYQKAYRLKEIKTLAIKVDLSVQMDTTFPITWWWNGWLVVASNVTGQ